MVQDTYAKYAEVRHRLGFMFRSRCILPTDMKSRRSFMDSVCRTFAGLLERRRRVLITSYKFHRLLAEVTILLRTFLIFELKYWGKNRFPRNGFSNQADSIDRNIYRPS